MSKKYDKYINEFFSNPNKFFTSYGKVVPMIPNKGNDKDNDKDKDLGREIRDRAIIELVKTATAAGQDLSYGDVRLIIDGDSTEKEYENRQISR